MPLAPPSKLWQPKLSPHIAKSSLRWGRKSCPAGSHCYACWLLLLLLASSLVTHWLRDAQNKKGTWSWNEDTLQVAPVVISCLSPPPSPLSPPLLLKPPQATSGHLRPGLALWAAGGKTVEAPAHVTVGVELKWLLMDGYSGQTQFCTWKLGLLGS